MNVREKLEDIVKEEIYKLRNLGERSRKGSDHLSYRSLTKFDLGKIHKLKDKNEIIYELICKYDIYTETEFLHTPDQDELYTEHYKDKFIFDKEFNIKSTEDLRDTE